MINSVIPAMVKYIKRDTRQRQVERFLKDYYDYTNPLIDHGVSILKALEPYDVAPRVLGAGQDYIVLEHCGWDLTSDRGQEIVHALGEKNLEEQARGILEVLEKESIKHNDIYRENVLVDNAGKLRLIDFALSDFRGIRGVADFYSKETIGNNRIFCARMTDQVIYKCFNDDAVDWVSERQKIISDIESVYPVDKGSDGAHTVKDWVYHGLPFREIPVRCQRVWSPVRVDKITSYLPKHQRGIDLGCSIGGVSFELARRGHKVLGVDYDRASIAFAKKVESYKRTGVQFHEGKIDFRFVERMDNFDFGVWLSSFMWVAKAEGEIEAKKILRKISTKVRKLFFDTAQGGTDEAESFQLNGKDEVYRLLKDNTFYEHIEDLGLSEEGYHRRNLFMCW